MPIRGGIIEQHCDLKVFVDKYLRTSSANRKTSSAEFNADADYMISLKQIYYDMLFLSCTEQTKSEATLMMAFMKQESNRLRDKHWPPLPKL